MTRGPCAYCAHLYCGKICTSPKAHKLGTGRKKYIPLKGQIVKIVSKQYNKRKHRMELIIQWDNCYYGISGFNRKRKKKKKVRK